MIDTDFFGQLDRFSFMVRKRVSNAYTGSRRSIKHGKGIDIIGYREYIPGDDFRTIDWKIYGRTEKLYIRQFEEERSVTTHILLDASKSMDYGGKDQNKNKVKDEDQKDIRKFDYAAMIGVGFAYLVTKDNEKFAISTFSETIEIAQPKRGRGYLLTTIDKLNAMPLEGKTDFANTFEQYAKTIHSRAVVVVVSDFLTDLNSIRTGLYRLGTNDLVVIQVLHENEVNITLDGDTKLHDLETDEVMRTYVSPRFKDEYKQQLDDHIAGVREICNELGADFHSFSTDKPIFDAFFEAISR